MSNMTGVISTPQKKRLALFYLFFGATWQLVRPSQVRARPAGCGCRSEWLHWSRDDGQSPDTQTVHGWPVDNLPKDLTVSQPAIAQVFHVPGVGGVLDYHRVMVVVVLAGLFLSSRLRAWILVLQQSNG